MKYAVISTLIADGELLGFEVYTTDDMIFHYYDPEYAKEMLFYFEHNHYEVINGNVPHHVSCEIVGSSR